MPFRLSLLSVLLHLVLNSVYADPPDWSVDPNAFIHNTNMVGQLYVNNVVDASTGNIIAAFVDGELRGVVEGQTIGTEQYYFLKIYTSTPTTDIINFKVYIAAEDAIFDIEESLEYTAINSSAVFAFNTYLNVDQPISLNTISDQNQVVGFPFDSIYLPDYLIQIDDDPIVWTYSGNTNLAVTIENDWLKVQSIIPSWTGTESITITATEQTPNAYSASQNINFTILPDFGPPEWDELSGQKIGRNQSFEDIDLATKLLPYGGTALDYHYFMPQPSGSLRGGVWSVDAGAFQYNMNVTAKVRYGSTDHAGSTDRLLAYIDGTLVGVAGPTLVNGEVIYFLSVYSNTNNVPVTLRIFDDDANKIFDIPDPLTFLNGSENGTPDEPLLFSTAPLAVTIDEADIASISPEILGWIGTHEIAFIVYDTFQPLINADTIYADFTIANEFAPVVSGVSDQYVEQGGVFTTFDLDDYVVEYDGDAIAWTVSSAINFTIEINNANVVSITVKDPAWTGEETVRFRATDITTCGLYDEQEVTFTIGTPNQAPKFILIPDQVIGIGDTFPDLDLNDYLTEPNDDPVTWSYFFKTRASDDTAPDWNLNPGSFQYNMTVTAQVQVRETYPSATGHQLAAFHEGTIRGVANAQLVNGDWLFFMNVYSNQSNDSIYFQYYDPDQDIIYAVDDSLRFISQLQTGSAGAPFELHAGFVDPQHRSALLSPTVIDEDWMGADTLYAVATEVGTHERYRDTAEIIFKVQAAGPNLPVDLLAFTVRKEGEAARLNWEIANPDQIYVYEIYRATGPDVVGRLDWEPIGHLMHESDQYFYSFMDQLPAPGKNYYRLKMIDEDGSYSFSDIINIDFGGENTFSISCFPNPAQKDIHLDIKSEQLGDFTLELVNAMGHTLLKMEQHLERERVFIVLDAAQYPAGQYYIKVRSAHQSKTLPLLLLKP